MPRPQRREEIVPAVVSAATALFAKRGPAAVSLREIAAVAGVTLSQIHRHIGNKEALLAAVLAADVANDGGIRPSFDGLDLANFLKTLFRLGEASVRTELHARVILDGYDLPALQHRYPGIELAMELMRLQIPDEQARVRAALLVTFFGGWQLLGPTYLRVTGIDDVTPERFAEIVAPVLDAIATAPAGPETSRSDRRKADS